MDREQWQGQENTKYHKLVRKRSKRTVTELRAFGPDLRLGGESEGSERNFILTQFMEFTNRFENKQKELSPRLLCGCKITTSQPFFFRYTFNIF